MAELTIARYITWGSYYTGVSFETRCPKTGPSLLDPYHTLLTNLL